MDLTEEQLTTALQEAFTYYLRFLSHTQKLRELKLPRQGKGIETHADVSTQQYYRCRVVATETCLQYTEKIARKVLRWNDDPDPAIDESYHIEQVGEGDILEDEEPFLDIFSGKWTRPETLCSAGPSGSKYGATIESLQGPENDQTECLSESPRRPESEPKAPEMKEIMPIFRCINRPSLGIHPNAPLLLSCLSLDQELSPKSSLTRVTDPLTPTTTYTSVEEEDEENTKGENSGTNLDRKPAERSGHSNLDDTDIEDNSEDMKGSARESKDMREAQKLYAEEKRRRDDIHRSGLQAQRLAEKLEQEEEARIQAQATVLKRLEQQERHREEQIRKDRHAALKAQEKWDLAASLLLAEAEQQRAESMDREKDKEDHRRQRSERRSRDSERTREASHAPEEGIRVGDRSHSEVRRRHMHHERKESPKRPSAKQVDPPKRARFSDRVPSARKTSLSTNRQPSSVPKVDAPGPTVADSPRKAEPHKHVKEPKKIDCVSCMELGNRKDMAILPCKHAYCEECINEAFRSAYKSHTLFKCCGTIIPSTSIPTLSSSFSARYALLSQELTTSSPRYCSSPTCSKFLPPSAIHGPLGICPRCKTRTCIPCGKNEHSGVCKQDKEGKKFEDLAKKKGWKQCPNCSQILERTFGCLHMTCRCGSEWCWACLREWRVCGSSCSRGEPNNGDFALPPAMNDFAQLPNLLAQTMAQNNMFWARGPPHRDPPAGSTAAGGRRRNTTAAGLFEAVVDVAVAGRQNTLADDFARPSLRGTIETRRTMGGAAATVIPVIAGAVLMALFGE